MPEIQFADIAAVLSKRAIPTIMAWNRLEGRPRAEDFKRSLRAEVRDALWMLSRQWQMGEFRGDDAGSPVSAKVHVGYARLNKYQPDIRDVQGFNEDVPLEAKVEQRALPLSLGSQKMALDLRLQMGRQWLRMLSRVGDFSAAFIKGYPISVPDRTLQPDPWIWSHPEVLSQYAAVAGRAMDGAALYNHLIANPANRAYDPPEVIIPDDKKADVDRVAEAFVKWFQDLYFQPDDPRDNAWRPSYLEYGFRCSAPMDGTDKVLAAEEYYHGHLDWYSVDVDADLHQLGESPTENPTELQGSITHAFIPTQVSFDGMPNTRWWAFEDSRTSFGDINPDTTDLAKLLLIEFGLTYANDWFMLPLALPVGCLSRVRGLAVTNVFGERFWIKPSNQSASSSWERWNMFGQTIRNGAGSTDNVLVLLPTVPRIQESKPLDRVVFIRDEMANMVWGIETVIPVPDGTSMPGREAAFQLRSFMQQLIDERVSDGTVTPVNKQYSADIYYQVMNSIPEHWIPFISIHRPDSDRQVQLQRAALPRVLQNGPQPPDAIRPRSFILREGLDSQPAQPYFVHEEEVPRAGVVVSQSFHRARWYKGRTLVWLGARKGTGRGEGASGLAFDQIRPVQ